MSASSVNSQPWHFILAGSDEGKTRIAKATQGGFRLMSANFRCLARDGVLRQNQH